MLNYNPANLPVSDRWGHGITRRAIRLRGLPGRVEVALEDHCHAMLCTVWHENGLVTRVDADFRRYTLNHCPAAAAPLAELVGMPISIDTRSFFSGGRARRNCTHMLDMAWLAIRHAGRGEIEWLYEMEIPDAPNGKTEGHLRRNGETILSWSVVDDVIMAPERYKGRALLGGFVRWAVEQSGFDELEVEECLVLYKGFFMVGARRLELPPGPRTFELQKGMQGSCFGYAPERVADAVGEAGMFRDFSEHPERLLRFE